MLELRQQRNLVHGLLADVADRLYTSDLQVSLLLDCGSLDLTASLEAVELAAYRSAELGRPVAVGEGAGRR